jgi:TolB-like protein/tRNA A-37 threonylcarbamoyl transferase component Bud32/Flp pilus assembly protein TadD
VSEPDLPLRRALADRYRLEHELGAGAMATVFLAEDLRHHRQVAIKVLKPELAASLGTERFLKEIETTANLRHPHILPLHDSGEAAGTLFYVMPLVEGESLRDRIAREKQLPIDQALTIAREVGDALAYAHARGIIHRDIKPENILLEGGHAVVADFGIARALGTAGTERLTQTGLSVGTPLYMSPEQAAGSPDLDARSDVYSLACVVYEMLAGEPPFTGVSAAAIARQHMVTEAAPVTNKRPAVPVAVVTALARALAKDPADRFSRAAEFAQALEAESPSASRTPVPRTVGQSRRRVMGFSAAAVVTVLAAWFLFGRVPAADVAAFDRIAVLPMDNETGDASQRFFADGMTRELIGVLSDAGVRVLGHRAVAPYQNSSLSSAEIARALRVDAIVTGAVLKSGDVVQISSELIDPKSGESLWARTFSRPAANVVMLQHEIAREIARGIHARLTPDQSRSLAAAGPVHPKAYTQYLLGQEQAALRTPDGFRRSVEYLNRSIAIDSTFAPAWAALALTNAYALLYKLTPDDSGRAVVERTSARAAALDARLGDPWFARGVAHLQVDWNYAAAEEDFRRGLERTHSTQARALRGWTLWETGRPQEAIAFMTGLIDLEPTTAQWHSDLAWSHWSSGNLDAARASLLKAVALDASFHDVHDLLALIESDAGNIAAAERYHRRAIEAGGGDYWVRPLAEAVLLEAKGDRDGMRLLQRSLARDARHAQRAVIAHLLGERDATYASLQRAVETHDGDLLWVLTAVPYLYPLREDAPFQAILRRVGLPATRPS